MSIYGFIVLLFIASGWVLDEAWHEHVKEDAKSYAGYETLIEALEQYGLNNTEAEWDKLYRDFSTRFNIPLRVSTITELAINSNEKIEQLNQGQTIVKTENQTLFIARTIGSSKKLIVIGPVGLPERPKIASGLRITLLLLIAAALFVWLRPISKDLEHLKNAAAAFGEGDLTARAAPAKSNTMKLTVSAFNLMAIRIKRLVDAFKELTNAVSHELRTPLARSKFALQILEGVDDPEKQKKYLGQIRSDIHELEELINEMLVYASFDSDKPRLNFQSYSVKEIIENQASLHQDFNSTITIIFEQSDFNIVCDRYFIERALSNFITNANKYGGDEILIVAAENNESYSISVHDNGSGVSDDFKAKAFDAFTRADMSRNKETAGFGLGLAIVQRVMEWHQGTAHVGDSDLGGASFSIQWPKNIE